jgi:ADP-heptose:LPS heptosyltransferase
VRQAPAQLLLFQGDQEVSPVWRFVIRVARDAFKKLEKILLIRLDALGDTILTTPLIRELKLKLPDTQVTVLASEKGLPALEGNSDIRDIITLDHEKVGLTEARRCAESLAGRKFSASINVSEKIWGYILPFLAGIPLRIGFTPGWSAPFKALLCRLLLTNGVQYLNMPQKAMGEHEVERQMRLLGPLGFQGIPGPLFLNVERAEKDAALEILRQRGFPGAGRVIALHLSEKWLREGYSESLLVGFLERMGSAHPEMMVLVTYGPADEGLARGVREGLKGVQVITYSDPSFKKWAAMLSLADVVITMDTSASHVAAALGIPVIVVFPEQYYEHCTERWRPWKVPHRLIMKKSAVFHQSGEEMHGLEDELIRALVTLLEDESLWKNS